MEHRTTNQPEAMVAAETPWQNCIAVCEKCAGKLGAMDGDKTRLRVELKELIAARDLKKKVRAVDGSCFDLCPEGKITVIHFTQSGIVPVNVGATTPAPAVLKAFGY